MTSAVIVDTNVVVAGLLAARPDSPVARVLDGMLDGAWPFVVSDVLLAEYREVLLRPKLRKRHGLGAEDIDMILLELARHAIILHPAPGNPVAPDPGDQHLWDLLHARIDLLLVTGDLRLLAATDFASRILLPQAFAERFLAP